MTEEKIILWLPEYNTGVSEIDTQHQQFVGIMNELYKASTNGDLTDKQDILNILNQLITYCKFHFATEERYFDLFKYQYAEEHKKQHKELLAQVEQFSIEHFPSADAAGKELFLFLEKWLVNHLIYADRKYVRCFMENGLK